MYHNFKYKSIKYYLVFLFLTACSNLNKKSESLVENIQIDTIGDFICITHRSDQDKLLMRSIQDSFGTETFYYGSIGKISRKIIDRGEIFL